MSPAPLGDTCGDRVSAGEAPFNHERDRYCSELSFNTASYGGGIFLNDSVAKLMNYGVIGNDGTSDRAAVFARNGSAMTLNGSLVAANVSGGAQAVLVYNSSDLEVLSTTFSQDLDVWIGLNSTSAIDNSIFWHDNLVGMDMLQMSAGGSGSGDCNMGQGVVNLSGTNYEDDDPLFVTIPETDYFLDTNYLMPSPALDKCPSGSGSAFELFGFSRVGWNNTVDVGAFEVF